MVQMRNRRLDCPHCPRKFHDERGLAKHIGAVHGREQARMYRRDHPLPRECDETEADRITLQRFR